MAFNLKIQGNFFVIYDTVARLDIIRSPKSNTRYLFNDSETPSIYSFYEISKSGSVFSKNSPVFEFTDLIDDRTDLAFTSDDELNEFLSTNIGDFFLGSEIDKESYGDFDIKYALTNILTEFSDVVSLFDKSKPLTKFGRNDNIGTTSATIMTLPAGILNETYVSTNIIDTISSSDAADTQDINVEGHTIDGSGDFTFVEQTATLNGQTKVVLSTPLARINRLTNSNGVNTVGTIYCYEDTPITSGVPTDSEKVHCMINSTRNQSQKASTTISKNDYWLVTKLYGDILEKTASYADVVLEIRYKGKVFLNKIEVGTAANGGRIEHFFKPLLVIPPNSDVRLTSTADGAGTTVSGGIQGYLGIIKT